MNALRPSLPTRGPITVAACHAFVHGCVIGVLTRRAKRAARRLPVVRRVLSLGAVLANPRRVRNTVLVLPGLAGHAAVVEHTCPRATNDHLAFRGGSTALRIRGALQARGRALGGLVCVGGACSAHSGRWSTEAASLAVLASMIVRILATATAQVLALATIHRELAGCTFYAIQHRCRPRQGRERVLRAHLAFVSSRGGGTIVPTSGTEALTTVR